MVYYLARGVHIMVTHTIFPELVLDNSTYIIYHKNIFNGTAINGVDPSTHYILYGSRIISQNKGLTNYSTNNTYVQNNRITTIAPNYPIRTYYEY